MDSSNIVNLGDLRSQSNSPAIPVDGNPKPHPLVPETYESRKLMKLYLDRDAVLDATEVALLDGDLTPIWQLRMVAAAWKERIPGSLPNDDMKLARLISGGNLGLWMSMKGPLLRDWIVCSNGRLYNAAVADAIILSVKQWRQRTEAGARGRAVQAAKRAAKKAEAELLAANHL